MTNPQTKNRPPAQFHSGLVAPRYWGTWLLLGLLWTISWLPRKWIMRIGSIAGNQMRLRNEKRRRIAKINIGLCFSELTKTEQNQLVDDHFRCYGQGLLDMGLIMMATKERIEKFSRIEGLENLTNLAADEKKILVTYHTTTLDMFSSSLLADFNVVSMMKRDKNPVLNWFLYRSRTRYKRAHVLMRDESLRGVVTGMNEGRICCIIPDEDFGIGRHTVFAPFFGQQRSTLNIVSRLAKITGASVIPGICCLDSETGYYVTTLHPRLKNFPSGDHIVDAANLNNVMEGLIRQVPEQYLWTFRWFRTQPEGMPNPYEEL